MNMGSVSLLEAIWSLEETFGGLEISSPPKKRGKKGKKERKKTREDENGESE